MSAHQLDDDEVEAVKNPKPQPTVSQQRRMKAALLARAAFTGQDTGAVHFQDGKALKKLAEDSPRRCASLLSLGHWSALVPSLRVDDQEGDGVSQRAWANIRRCRPPMLLAWLRLGLMRRASSAPGSRAQETEEEDEGEEGEADTVEEDQVCRIWTSMEISKDTLMDASVGQSFARLMGVVVQRFSWVNLTGMLLATLTDLTYETELRAAAMAGGAHALEWVQTVYDPRQPKQPDNLLEAAAYGGDVKTFAWVKQKMEEEEKRKRAMAAKQLNTNRRGGAMRARGSWDDTIKMTECFKEAVEMSHMRMAQYIVKHGGGIFVDGGERMSDPAILIASRIGYLPMLRFVVAQGGDANLRNDWQDTSLMCAARNGHRHIIKWLIAEAGADINLVAENETTNEYWTTVLLDACSQGYTVPIVEYLLELGADMTIADYDGATPLMVAAEHGHLSLVHVLLKAGADPHVRNKNGQSALDCAERQGHAAIADVLRDL